MFRFVGMMLLVLLIAGCSTPSPRDTPALVSNLVRRQCTRICMGVQCRLVFYAPKDADTDVIAQAAFARIDQIDAAVSDYRVDSDVARLAHAAGASNDIQIQPDTNTLLALSMRIATDTGGAFDPTVGPVTRLWRQARATQVIPESAAIQHAVSLVNYHWFESRHDESGRACARLSKPGMSLDFGAIAKGYAAEEAVLILKSRGAHSCLVALSGDIFCGDPPPGEPGWKVDIASGQNGNSPHATILLSNQGLSTSGDTEQFIELGGVRYSHIIDPRKGWAITARRSVTVIGPHGWMHDALSTALCVMGSQDSVSMLAHYPECAAIFFENDGGRTHKILHGNSQLLDRIRFKTN